MKNITFIAAILMACCISANAAEKPIDRGSVILSGTMYFENQRASGSSMSSFMLATDIGGFLAPRCMLGVSVAINSVSIDDETSSVYSIGPVAGVYYDIEPTRREIRGSVFPYLKAFFRYTAESRADVHFFGFGGAGGINIMISDAVAVDMGILFSLDELHSDYGSSPTITTIRIGAGIVSFIY